MTLQDFNTVINDRTLVVGEELKGDVSQQVI